MADSEWGESIQADVKKDPVNRWKPKAIGDSIQGTVELKDGARFFTDGTIPEVNVLQACHQNLTLFSELKDKGLIATCPGGFKVVM